MTTNQFYHELESFSDFHGITLDQHFKKVPKDWKVIITDIVDSTKAIEAGRYKEVNIVGAAAIAAVQNSINNQTFPSSFGGDGASLLMSPQHIEPALKALSALRSLATEKFQLTLRVGMVEVAELLQESAHIEIAKYELNHGRCVAIFRGGGLSLAEKKVKQSPAKYAIASRQDQHVDLSGLSCRWKAIPNQKGQILSIIISARHSSHPHLYQHILQNFDNFFDGELNKANPVHIPNIRSQSFWQCLQNERQYSSHHLSLAFLRRLLEISTAFLLYHLKIPPFVTQPGHYLHAMQQHSDYRKFDEGLKLVLDCSDPQASNICTYLEDLYQKNEIFYGIHHSDNSLMTCYVQGLEDGKHIHFIDGDHGGYAMAAKQLKQQMKDAS